MNFFVISDIHGSIEALEKAMERFQVEKADYIIICGDFLNHGPRNPLPEGYNTKAVAEKLNSIKDKIICVKGNCDSEVDQMMLDFPVLQPIGNVFLSNGKRIFIHHGHSYSKEAVTKYVLSDTIIVSGHSHIPELEITNVDGKKLLFINPGSISIPKGNSEPSYGIIKNDESSTVVEIISIKGEKLKSVDFN